MTKGFKKEISKDKSGFGGKAYIPREHFREWLKRPEHFKTLKKPTRERVKLEKELFGPEYGHYIERGEPEKVLKKLEKEKFRAATGAEKEKIDKKIRLIEKFLGK